MLCRDHLFFHFPISEFWNCVQFLTYRKKWCRGLSWQPSSYDFTSQCRGRSFNPWLGRKQYWNKFNEDLKKEERKKQCCNEHFCTWHWERGFLHWEHRCEMARLRVCTCKPFLSGPVALQDGTPAMCVGPVSPLSHSFSCSFFQGSQDHSLVHWFLRRTQKPQK